jgi:flavin-binding protein dodecin
LFAGGGRGYSLLEEVPASLRCAPRRRPLFNPPENAMSDHVYKMIEIVGSSPVSSDEAIRNAIETSAKTIRHISWFEVVKTTGHVVEGKVAHFQVTLKIGFRIEDQ